VACGCSAVRFALPYASADDVTGVRLGSSDLQRWPSSLGQRTLRLIKQQTGMRLPGQLTPLSESHLAREGSGHGQG